MRVCLTQSISFVLPDNTIRAVLTPPAFFTSILSIIPEKISFLFPFSSSMYSEAFPLSAFLNNSPSLPSAITPRITAIPCSFAFLWIYTSCKATKDAIDKRIILSLTWVPPFSAVYYEALSNLYILFAPKYTFFTGICKYKILFLPFIHQR